MKIEKNSDNYRYVKKKQKNIAKPKQRVKPSSLAKKVLLKGENLREFEELRVQMLSDLGPQSKIENIFCEKIIFTLWKLRRATEIEKNLLNKENELTFEETHEALQNPWDPPPRKRISNINKVTMESSEVQSIMQHQLELEKMLQKQFSRLRAEQKLRKHAENDEK